MVSWYCENQCPAQQMVQSNINHLNQVSAGCQKPHTTDTSVQGCWYSANVTVSGTIPTYGSDHRPYPHWSHSTAMALRSLSIIKADIYLQDRLKNKSMHVTECHVVFGEKHIEMWKKRLKKKCKNPVEDVWWKCLRPLQREHFIQDWWNMSYWTGLTNKVMIAFPFTARGLNGYFHYIFLFFHSQQKFTFDVSFSWALHSSLWDQLLQVPVSR